MHRVRGTFEVRVQLVFFTFRSLSVRKRSGLRSEAAWNRQPQQVDTGRPRDAELHAHSQILTYLIDRALMFSSYENQNTLTAKFAKKGRKVRKETKLIHY